MRTVFLADNLFSDVQHTTHVIDASTEDAGHQAWRVGTARRTALNAWTPTTFNTDAWVRVDCGSAKTADMVVIDRGHNLAGELVRVQRSTDGVAWTTVATATIPAAPSSGGVLTTAPGVHTEEGAWAFRFAAATYRYWRLLVPAMGVGLRPLIVGLYLGQSWAPQYPIDLPFADDDVELAYTETVSDLLWSGGTRPATRRRGEIAIKLSDEAERVSARDVIRQQFMRGRAMWIVFDDERAEGAVLAKAPPQRLQFPTQAANWSWASLSFAWIEHERVIG